MFLNEELILEIQESPILGIKKAIESYLDFINNNISDFTRDEKSYMFEIYATIQLMLDGGMLSTSLAELSGADLENPKILHKYLKNIYSEISSHATLLELDKLKNKLKPRLNIGFSYNLSQGDLDRIQSLVDELRFSISNADYMDDEYKQRLLKRLEGLQSEIHKKVSNFDRFYGFIGDLGIAAGKFGKNVKPLTDRFREVIGIIQNNQAREEELPSNTVFPMLSDSNSDTTQSLDS